MLERRDLIDRETKAISITKQCKLLDVCRSSLYIKPKRTSELNLELMREMDEHYLEFPFKGAPRMHTYLTKDLGYNISQNRVDRLYYSVMGLRSILPGPHTSKRHKDHKVYPYLLRDLEIKQANQVWAMDITYVPTKKGFMYLTAIIDLYSRFVVGWSLSNTMEAQWCADVFIEAVQIHGAPKIMNTDQGCQFTSKEFTEAVLASKAKLSMDGKGRATDNAFIERLWRSVKYEYVYIQAHETVMELFKGIEKYFIYYNEQRRHSSINDRYPQEVYENRGNNTQVEKAA